MLNIARRPEVLARRERPSLVAFAAEFTGDGKVTVSAGGDKIDYKKWPLLQMTADVLKPLTLEKTMPDKEKKLARARMEKTGESYQTALQQVRKRAPNRCSPPTEAIAEEMKNPLLKHVDVVGPSSDGAADEEVRP